MALTLILSRSAKVRALCMRVYCAGASGARHVARPMESTTRSFNDQYAAPYSSSAAVVKGKELPGAFSRFYNPQYCEAMAKIMRIRQDYIKNRAVFIIGQDMLPALQCLGANPAELTVLQSLSATLGKDPTLPYRNIRSGRFCIDFDHNVIRRLEHRPFLLSAAEGFKRFDSGQPRLFEELEDDIQQNTVFRALLLFKAMIIYGVKIMPRPQIDYTQNKFLSRAFHIRTTTSPKLLGHPASEGVHSDGADHVMSTFLDSHNMTATSGATYLHSTEQTSGVQLNQAEPEYILQRIRHQHPLDTLIVIDYEHKHSLTSVKSQNSAKHATRDVLVFFTRGPPMRGHVSLEHDTTTEHQRLKMEIPLHNP